MYNRDAAEAIYYNNQYTNNSKEFNKQASAAFHSHKNKYLNANDPDDYLLIKYHLLSVRPVYTDEELAEILDSPLIDGWQKLRVAKETLLRDKILKDLEESIEDAINLQ